MFEKNPFLIQYPLYFPEENTGGAEGNENNNDGDNIDLGEGRAEGGTEEEEEFDDEGNLIDKSKENKEDVTEDDLVRVPLSTINEKHPNFFKDFPSLKHAFFREQKFSEIFPTIKDAELAAQQQAAFLEISEAVISGDTDRFIQELKSADDKALTAFSANFLESLKNESKDTYFEVLEPIVVDLVRNVYRKGVELSKKDEKNGKNMQLAAKIVYAQLTGNDYDKIDDDTTITRKSGMMNDRTEGKDRKDSASLNDDQQQKYANLRADIGSSLAKNLNDEIAKGFADIKGSDTLKEMAIEKISNLVRNEMIKDENYNRRMNALWDREKRLGFNGTLRESFKTNFMGKARTLIPKFRAEIRKQLFPGNTTKKDDVTRPDAGNRSSSGGAKTLTREEIKGKTAREIFN